MESIKEMTVDQLIAEDVESPYYFSVDGVTAEIDCIRLEELIIRAEREKRLHRLIKNFVFGDSAEKEEAQNSFLAEATKIFDDYKENK